MEQEYNINSSIIRGRGHIQFNLFRLILNTINEVDNTTINESINQTNLEKPVIADFLKNLKKEIISNEMISEDLECAICLEKFKLNEKCIQLPCNDRHIFFIVILMRIVKVLFRGYKRIILVLYVGRNSQLNHHRLRDQNQDHHRLWEQNLNHRRLRNRNQNMNHLKDQNQDRNII